MSGRQRHRLTEVGGGIVFATAIDGEETREYDDFAASDELDVGTLDVGH